MISGVSFNIANRTKQLEQTSNYSSGEEESQSG